jgi:hypothetical protein
MCRRSQKIHVVPRAIVLALLSSVVSWSIFVFAEDPVATPPAPPELLPDNVRILARFEERYLASYRNMDAMQRTPRSLVSRIAEYLTKQPLPASPPPPYRPAIPTDDAWRSAAPVASRRPVFELSPVAWSMKVVNLNEFFLPQLREEVIVVVRFTPEYFRENVFADGTWVLAHLRKSNREAGHDIGDGPYPSDSTGRWDLALTPELLDQGPPNSSRLRKTANIRSYKARPSLEQISEFVYSTDFGNNDIYRSTSVARRMDVDVVVVAVYPVYATLGDAFRAGLRPETIAQRKTAYQEAFSRDGINPSPKPKGLR